MTKISWVTYTVQDFIDKGEAEVKTGPFGTQLHASDYVETGTPVINARNIGFGEMRAEKLEYISDETVQRLSSHLLEPSDIVFGRKGTVERHVFIQPEQAKWFQGTDCLRLRFKSPAIEPRFVSYCLLTEQHKQWIMNQSSHGATMTSLNQAIIGRISLQLPPISTQRRIASILSAYDDLIENNTRRIKILEQMTQAIYREWFVEFRAPGVKLRQATPEEQKVTGKDRFPAGWEIKPVGELLSYHIGGGWGEEEESEKFPVAAYVIRGTDIPTARSASTDGVPLRYHKRSNFEPRKLEVGDIVFEVSGGGKEIPVGRSLLVTQRLLGKFDQSVICASFCKLLRPNKEVVLPELLYLHLVDFFDSRRIVQFQVQSTGIKNLKFAHFLEGEFVTVPDQATQAKYAEASLPMFDMIQTLGLKNANLRQTRDLLLPRLVGGEIIVET